ncbi:unnamed protein product [Peronospora belbahrii]|uniref:FYVE-type domain-containing protein n=2 Tax=Peronospora belbahrii TaxID=622444 RepID=A0AAU9KW90_9STRA|nr:unnamed protein product [Peronospora belbahrii]
MRWKRIHLLSDDTAKLYENLPQGLTCHMSRIGSYSLRAVKVLRASLAEVEAVLTGQTELLGRDDTPSSLLARLLPATYVSGGSIRQYPMLYHSTSEQEKVALEYTRVKPYTAVIQEEAQEEVKKKAVVLELMDNHVLLSYTLLTQLQRSDTSKKTKKEKENMVVTPSVPSLLHLYRPVRSPVFAERRQDFRLEKLATSDFDITYIIQETPRSREDGDLQKDAVQTVTLEVVLTCSLESSQVEMVVDNNNKNKAKKDLERQQKQRIRHDALCLTRLQPYIDAYRQEKFLRPQSYQSQPREPQHDPRNCDPNMLRGSLFAGGRTCGVCHRKFRPFRWKRQCEACEKLVCNQCVSVLAVTPSLSRRKKRMCSQCMYNETANAAAMHKDAAEAIHDNAKSLGSSSGSVIARALRENSRANVSQFPSLDSLVTQHKLSRKAASVEMGESSKIFGRLQIDFGLDPSLVSTCSDIPDRRRARSRQSQLSQGSVVSTTSNASSTNNLVAATNDNRRATLPTHIDLYDVESAVVESMRSRRAKTVLLDDAEKKPVTHKALDLITSVSSSPPTYYLHSTLTKEVNYEEEQRQRMAIPHASSCETSKMEFIQLTTPKPDYELDFSWYNIFPKAPVERTAAEFSRAKYVEVTGLKLDARSLVFLRHDKALADLASCVLKVASQWNTCSINVVGSYKVYCLVTAFNKPDPLDLDGGMLELETSPVVVDNVVPREESVSSYVVHYRSPFFVGEMEQDSRFRAHPLHTEQRAVSLLSFPIYSSGADASGVHCDGEAYCVATLDLWKRDNVPASSYISHDWMSNMGDLLRKISARLEDVALESHAGLIPLPHSTHSLGSLYDSRGIARHADSIINPYEIGSESMVDLSSFSQAETMDQLTSLSYAKVRGVGLGGITSPGSLTWKYNSDNESTTSSQSASSSCSQSSRYSSHLYSAADMHTTIESLLHQASKTSQYISETGVFI